MGATCGPPIEIGSLACQLLLQGSTSRAYPGLELVTRYLVNRRTLWCGRSGLLSLVCLSHRYRLTCLLLLDREWIIVPLVLLVLERLLGG